MEINLLVVLLHLMLARISNCLFIAGKELRSKVVIKLVWFSNGKVFVRKDDNSNGVVIRKIQTTSLVCLWASPLWPAFPCYGWVSDGESDSSLRNASSVHKKRKLTGLSKIELFLLLLIQKSKWLRWIKYWLLEYSWV